MLLGLGLCSMMDVFSLRALFGAGPVEEGAVGVMTGSLVAEVGVVGFLTGCGLSLKPFVESWVNLLGLSSPQDSRASSLSSSASRSSLKMLYCIAGLGANARVEDGAGTVEGTVVDEVVLGLLLKLM